MDESPAPKIILLVVCAYVGWGTQIGCVLACLYRHESRCSMHACMLALLLSTLRLCLFSFYTLGRIRQGLLLFRAHFIAPQGEKLGGQIFIVPTILGRRIVGMRA